MCRRKLPPYQQQRIGRLNAFAAHLLRVRRRRPVIDIAAVEDEREVVEALQRPQATNDEPVVGEQTEGGATGSEESAVVREFTHPLTSFVNSPADVAVSPAADHSALPSPSSPSCLFVDDPLLSFCGGDDEDVDYNRDFTRKRRRPSSAAISPASEDRSSVSPVDDRSRCSPGYADSWGLSYSCRSRGRMVQPSNAIGSYQDASNWGDGAIHISSAGFGQETRPQPRRGGRGRGKWYRANAAYRYYHDSQSSTPEMRRAGASDDHMISERRASPYEKDQGLRNKDSAQYERSRVDGDDYRGIESGDQVFNRAHAGPSYSPSPLQEGLGMYGRGGKHQPSGSNIDYVEDDYQPVEQLAGAPSVSPPDLSAEDILRDDGRRSPDAGMPRLTKEPSGLSTKADIEQQRQPVPSTRTSTRRVSQSDLPTDVLGTYGGPDTDATKDAHPVDSTEHTAKRKFQFWSDDTVKGNDDRPLVRPERFVSHQPGGVLLRQPDERLSGLSKHTTLRHEDDASSGRSPRQIREHFDSRDEFDNDEFGGRQRFFRQQEEKQNPQDCSVLDHRAPSVGSRDGFDCYVYAHDASAAAPTQSPEHDEERMSSEQLTLPPAPLFAQSNQTKSSSLLLPTYCADDRHDFILPSTSDDFQTGGSLQGDSFDGATSSSDSHPRQGHYFSVRDSARYIAEQAANCSFEVRGAMEPDLCGKSVTPLGASDGGNWTEEKTDIARSQKVNNSEVVQIPGVQPGCIRADLRSYGPNPNSAALDGNVTKNPFTNYTGPVSPSSDGIQQSSPRIVDVSQRRGNDLSPPVPSPLFPRNLGAEDGTLRRQFDHSAVTMEPQPLPRLPLVTPANPHLACNAPSTPGLCQAPVGDSQRQRLGYPQERRTRYPSATTSRAPEPYHPSPLVTYGLAAARGTARDPQHPVDYYGIRPDAFGFPSRPPARYTPGSLRPHQQMGLPATLALHQLAALRHQQQSSRHLVDRVTQLSGNVPGFGIPSTHRVNPYPLPSGLSRFRFPVRSQLRR